LRTPARELSVAVLIVSNLLPTAGLPQLEFTEPWGTVEERFYPNFSEDDMHMRDVLLKRS